MQLFAFALLAIAVVTANEKICEPGSRMTSSCRDCICSKDGSTRVCTLEMCPDENVKNPRSRRQAIEKVDQSVDGGVTEQPKICEPGTKSKMDCNHCICSSDGTFQACTIMMCLENEPTNIPNTEETIPDHVGTTEISVEKPKICEPGTSYKIDCNDCQCSADGTSQDCTLMDCLQNDATVVPDTEEKIPDLVGTTEIPVEKQKMCEPGTSYKIDCNHCRCSNDGTSQVCTLMACLQNDATVVPDTEEKTPDLVGTTEIPVEKQKMCEPGTSYKIDCNHCQCSNDGTSQACTLMACLQNDATVVPDTEEKMPDLVGTTEIPVGKPNVPNPEEESTSVSQSEQTTSKSVYNKDGSLNIGGLVASDPISRAEPQFTHDRPCVPSQRFSSYCNSCTCGADGFSVACTKMECPDGVWNEDGSLVSP